MPRVLVAVVTWNSKKVIPFCLESLRGQSFQDFRVVIFDNASSDGTIQSAQDFKELDFKIIASDVNIGFAAANNRILEQLQDEEFVLFLNPDAMIEGDFLEKAANFLEAYKNVGCVSPKIKRFYLSGSVAKKTNTIDSAGIYLTKNGRHFDRGSGEEDNGQFGRLELVFGVTGAMAFYRRTCLEDIAVDGEIWDEDFFAYREDVDLAWRVVWRGWNCVYVPDLIGWHMRRVLPSNRRNTIKAANMHSVKNRFLLRIKNMPFLTWLKYFIPITFRDICVVVYVCLVEWSSLRAFIKVVSLLRSFFRKRRTVLGKAKISRRQMEVWFSKKSISFDE